MHEMQFKYVRIQGKELARNTMYAKGVFSMCWKLIQDDIMDPEDADLFREIDGWFAENLPWPPPCMNREPVVCWFKTENSDEMLKMICGCWNDTIIRIFLCIPILREKSCMRISIRLRQRRTATCRLRSFKKAGHPRSIDYSAKNEVRINGV